MHGYDCGVTGDARPDPVSPSRAYDKIDGPVPVLD